MMQVAEQSFRNWAIYYKLTGSFSKNAYLNHRTGALNGTGLGKLVITVGLQKIFNVKGENPPPTPNYWHLSLKKMTIYLILMAE